MTVIPTKLEGCYIIEPKIVYDERGYFMESYNEKIFEEQTGQKIHFVQDNQSFSCKGTLRGLHYQTGEHSQTKLVRILTGEVMDVAVDIRPGSVTYGQYTSVILSADNQRQFFIPKGFAHGFLVLSETATFFYKCDTFYNKESEAGIIYNDRTIGIKWGLPEESFITSDKDKNLPILENSREIW